MLPILPQMARGRTVSLHNDSGDDSDDLPGVLQTIGMLAYFLGQCGPLSLATHIAIFRT